MTSTAPNATTVASLTEAQRARTRTALRRRLQLLELDPLRALASDLHERLEFAEQRAYWAEQSADMHESLAESYRAQIEALESGQLKPQIGLTKSGQVLLLPAQRWTLLDASGDETTDEDSAFGARDNTSGITWLIASSKQEFRNDGAAEDYCKGLTYFGRTDWRLPTEPELLNGPRDITVREPAVHAPFRKGVRPCYHWSSSPFPGGEGYARVVSFSNGYSSSGHRSSVLPGPRLLRRRGGCRGRRVPRSVIGLLP